MFRSISVILSANSATFVSSMRTAGAAVDDFHRKAETGAAKSEAAAAKMHKTLVTLATVAATILAAGLISSVRAAAAFEVAMRNVATISDTVRENFTKSGQAVIDLSTKLPQSAKVLAEGLYEIASSGFQGAAGMEVLDKSARAASAGLTTTNVAAKGITAVLNAYGRSASEAEDVSDTLFQTVNLGVVTFEELSGQIGDFVGTAAQLGVPIADASAAFAAMTLSGISAAESATSVNRVMLAFIKPSEGMAAVLRSIGFESGAAAVAQLGLKGAMEAITEATGGGIEAMGEMFTEVRGLKGALALTAAEGANYTRSTNGIADAAQRAGATQRALDEQMKSATAQWRIFTNQIDAARINLGTKMLPVLVSVLRNVQEFGRDAAPALRSAMEALAPTFGSLVDIGGDLISILGDMAGGAANVAGALGGIAGSAAVPTLNAIAGALAAVTGFASEHADILTALAVIYGTRLAISIALTTAYLAVWNGHAIAATLASSGLVMALQQQVYYFGLLGLAIRALPYVAAIAGITATIRGISNAKREADQLSKTLKEGVDFGNPQSLQAYIDKLYEQQGALAATTQEGNRFSRFLQVVKEFATPLPNTLADATEGFKRLGVDLETAGRMSVSLSENVFTIMHATGATEQTVLSLAKSLGVDLTKSFGDSKAEREKIIENLKSMAQNAFGAGRGLAGMAGASVEAIKAASDAVDELAKKTRDAFSSGFDVLSNFAEATADHAEAMEAEASAADKVASAQDRVADAQQRAADAQEGITEAHERAAEAQEGVIEAHERVAESEQDLADLRVDVAERSAEAQERYAERVEESNENILRAEEDLADKRISLAEDVADAQRRIEEDRLEGQERVAAAEQRIRDVQKRSADEARERQQREADRKRLDNAKTPEERQRIQAEIDRRKAREDEQKARAQASKDLKDAQDDLAKIKADNAEKEKKNQEALADAQQAQAEGIKEAEDAVTEARKEGVKVQKEGRELAKQAVEDEKQIAAAVKSVEDARRGVIDAQKNAADAVNAISDAERDAAKAGAEVGRAQSDAAKAYEELAAAQKKVADTSLDGFFKNQIDQAKKFADGIREASRQGLDPAYIAQLLQEGPEKAAPILDAIMQDQTGTLVRQMNAARDGLKTVQDQMVEAARVTQRAINATNTDMAADYGRAMDILAAKAKLGGQATSEAIAAELGIGVAEVERIAKDYVIVLTKGINPLLAAIGAKPVAMDQEAGGARTSAGHQQFAMGGTVPGSGDRDSVPAMLTPGEYVISKPAVKRIGVDNLEAMHQKARRGYATGGFVYPNDVPVPPGEMDDWGTMLGYSGAMADQKMYYAVRDFVAKHPPNLGKGGSSAGGYGYQALIDFLRAKGVEHEVTSTQRDGSITSSGNASLHSVGQAADFVSSNMREIFDAFATITPSLQELFYDPVGWSVKNGARADFTVGGHDDHVHAASWAGASAGPAIPGVGGGGSGSAVAGGLYDWIDEAMRLTGVDGSWRDPLYRRAMYESSGDPKAINEWDSNAQAGTPSKGLMQCVPLDSEILTRDGWKRHDEVQLGDETLGFNPETGRNEWTKVTKIVHYEDAPVVRIGTRYWNARVTPNHRWWSEPVRSEIGDVGTTCPECGSEWKTVKGMTTHLGKKHHKKMPERKFLGGRFVRTNEFKTTDRLRLAAPAATEGIACLSTNEVRIIAWLQGAGHIRHAKEGGYDATIYQSKMKMVVKIREMLADVPHGEYARQRAGNCLRTYQFSLRRAYATELIKRSQIFELGDEAFVLALSPEQRSAWLSAMIDAEGNRQQGKKSNWNEFVRIAQVDGPLQDAIALAVYLEGFRPTFSRFPSTIDHPKNKPAGIVGMAAPHVCPVMFHDSQEMGNETVWCVKTDLETWTMRQGGRVMLTGNTIDSTFEAHKVDGHDDIWNPVDNMAAAIRYIIARYGSIHEIDPPVQGYAKGGLVDVLKNLPTFHAGGVVPGDKEVIARLEGGEGILSRQSMALGSPLGTYINQTISSALSRAGIGGGTATATMPDLSGLAAQIGTEVAAAFVKAGIKVEVNERQFGVVAATALHKMSKR